MHWIQNKSLSHYPSHNLRQLYLNPWAEYAVLNFQLLTNNDKTANLLQWFSMVGSAIGVSLIAELFGASKRGQILSGIFCATLPMGILQASSTQNDYVVAFWLVCFAYYTLLFFQTGNPEHSPLIGGALGLAMLTKGTTYIYALPLLVWLCFTMVYKLHGRSLSYLTAIALIALMLNIGHYSRNLLLFNNPLLVQDGPFSFSNAKMSVPLLASNLVRNSAIHLGSPVEEANLFFEKSIDGFHQLIGLKVNDQNITWPGIEFRIPRMILHEDFAGNPLHLVLITGSVLLLLLHKDKQTVTQEFFYSNLAGIILFNLLFRWQPWNSRLHLPSFVLWSPVVGLIISRFPKLKIFSFFIGSTLLLSALPWVLTNSMRPIAGPNNIFLRDRYSLYFSAREHLIDSYQSAGVLLAKSSCNQFGLLMNSDGPEYLLWVTLKDLYPGTFRLEHINVNNSSNVLAEKDPYITFNPCTLILIGQNPPEKIQFKNLNYPLVWNTPYVSIFMPVRQ
jgi:4-amino-4-deoxy-L-arabinose transferase-like glycosyltransferase